MTELFSQTSKFSRGGIQGLQQNSIGGATDKLVGGDLSANEGAVTAGSNIVSGAAGTANNQTSFKS